MSRYLLDTSIWVSWLKGDEALSNRLDALIDPDEAEVWSCGPVRLELLRGTDAADQQLIRETFNLAPSAPVEEFDFDEAATIYHLARSRGHTIRSSLDCLIAAVALRLDFVVVHRDVDFVRMASAIPALSVIDLTA